VSFKKLLYLVAVTHCNIIMDDIVDIVAVLFYFIAFSSVNRFH